MRGKAIREGTLDALLVVRVQTTRARRTVSTAKADSIHGSVRPIDISIHPLAVASSLNAAVSACNASAGSISQRGRSQVVLTKSSFRGEIDAIDETTPPTRTFTKEAHAGYGGAQTRLSNMGKAMMGFGIGSTGAPSWGLNSILVSPAIGPSRILSRISPEENSRIMRVFRQFSKLVRVLTRCPESCAGV